MYAVKVLDPNFKDHKVIARIYNLEGDVPDPEIKPYTGLGEVSYDRDGLVVNPDERYADVVRILFLGHGDSIFPSSI